MFGAETTPLSLWLRAVVPGRGEINSSIEGESSDMTKTNPDFSKSCLLSQYVPSGPSDESVSDFRQAFVEAPEAVISQGVDFPEPSWMGLCNSNTSSEVTPRLFSS